MQLFALCFCNIKYAVCICNIKQVPLILCFHLLYVVSTGFFIMTDQTSIIFVLYICTVSELSSSTDKLALSLKEAGTVNQMFRYSTIAQSCD